MFVVILRFSDNKARAGQFMQAHKQWIQSGVDDGVFLLVGSLKPEGGGAIVAYRESREALKDRVDQDPFVQEKVVVAEIIEIEPARVDDRLKFLVGG